MDASWNDKVLGHCDLDLLSRIDIESGANLLYSLRSKFPNLVNKNILGWGGCRMPFLCHCDRDP